ncbi:MAG: phosphoribosylformylglycinamidine synthase subunit PurS [Actinomycetota bacterium]
MKFHASIDVMPRTEISDPQGQTIERALPGIGFESVEEVRVGKRITLTVTAEDEQEARNILNGACERFLANPVIEDYEIHL